jgi:hypothetical protein
MSKNEIYLTICGAALTLAAGFMLGGPIWGLVFAAVGVVFLVLFLGSQRDRMGEVGLGNISPVPANLRATGETPQVIVEFSKDRLPFNARNKWVGERPIYVKNIGKSPAFNVQIGQVDTKFAIAKFPEVSVLEPGQREPVRPEITETSNLMPGTPGISEFEMMLQDKCAVGGWKGAEESMQITYRDALGCDLVTNLIAKYDVGGRTSATAISFDPTTHGRGK